MEEIEEKFGSVLETTQQGGSSDEDNAHDLHDSYGILIVLG